MRSRNPARIFAPLALIAAALAVYALVQPAMESGSASISQPNTTITTTTVKKPSVRSLKRVKTYTVKSGDTLSGIAAKTGLSVAHIVALNPDVDPNALSVGEKLTLRE
jgi:LysM repeat protein